MFPWAIDEINRENLQTQPPLDTVHHYLQAFTVTNCKAWVVQFISHLFEVQAGILKRTKTATEYKN